MTVTEIKEMIELVSDAGLTVVLAVLFILIAIRNHKNQQQWMEKFLEDKLSPRNIHPSHEDTAVLDIINDKIYKELRGLVNTLKVDRAYVYLYHNGGVSSSGLYFQRMSCICEVVSQGILPVVREKQNLYRASYTRLCDSLKNEGEFIVNDVDELKGHDDFLHQDLLARRTDSMYLRALKDSQNNVIGYVGVDYCSTNEDISNAVILGLLKTVSHKLSSLVDVRDEVKGG